MQRLGGFHRFCTNPLWQSQTRNFGRKRDRWREPKRVDKTPPQMGELYQISNLVLDLDAEDSPHVRGFNGQDVEKEKVKWGYDPAIDVTKDRVAEFLEEVADGIDRMESARTASFSKWHISDPDIFAVALMGGSNVESGFKDQGQSRSSLFKTLQRNGIPDRILAQDANRVLHFMLHRKSLGRSISQITEEEQQRRIAGEMQDFQTAVRACRSLDELRRFCSRVLKFESGQILKGVGGHEISQHCQQFRGPENDPKILGFLNNLMIQQASRNSDIGKSLSLLGLRIATTMMDLSSLVRYLDVCLQNKWLGGEEDDTVEDLIRRKEAMPALLQLVTERRDTADAGIRAHVFTLLTGRRHGTTFTCPSIKGTLRDSPLKREAYEVYVSYILLLGELGALRMLWYEWRFLRQRATLYKLKASWPLDFVGKRVFAEAVARFARLLGPQAKLLSKVGAPGSLQSYYTATASERARDATFETQDAWLDLEAITHLELRGAGSTSQLEISARQVLLALTDTSLSKALPRLCKIISEAKVGRHKMDMGEPSAHEMLYSSTQDSPTQDMEDLNMRESDTEDSAAHKTEDPSNRGYAAREMEDLNLQETDTGFLSTAENSHPSSSDQELIKGQELYDGVWDDVGGALVSRLQDGCRKPIKFVPVKDGRRVRQRQQSDIKGSDDLDGFGDSDDSDEMKLVDSAGNVVAHQNGKAKPTPEW